MKSDLVFFLPVDEGLKALVFYVATLLDNESSATGPTGNIVGQSITLLNSTGFQEPNSIHLALLPGLTLL